MHTHKNSLLETEASIPTEDPLSTIYIHDLTIFVQ